MTSGNQRTGTVRSGDVSIFFRAFGTPGRAPIMILHGANYFDSYDWIGVASALARDREVVAFDLRGFGQSDWSPSKDYSLDAVLGDMLAISDHFGWDRPIVMGHSVSGRYGIFYGSCFPGRLSKLIIVDSQFGHGSPGAYKVSLGNMPLIFPTVEAAMAHFAPRPSPPRFSHDRARAELGLRKTDDGYLLLRDPDYRNCEPQGADAPKVRLRDLDTSEELAKVACPIQIIRGLKSNRFPPEAVERIERDYPHIRWDAVDSNHDVATNDPAGVVRAVRDFVGAD